MNFGSNLPVKESITQKFQELLLQIKLRNSIASQKVQFFPISKRSFPKCANELERTEFNKGLGN